MSDLKRILAEEGLIKTGSDVMTASKLRNAAKRAVGSMGGYSVGTLRLYKQPLFTKYEDFQTLGLTATADDPARASMNKQVFADFARTLASKLGVGITEGPGFDSFDGSWRATLGAHPNKIVVSGYRGEGGDGHSFSIVVYGPKKAAPLTIPYYD
jgi:hypothetical protein